MASPVFDLRNEAGRVSRRGPFQFEVMPRLTYLSSVIFFVAVNDPAVSL